MSTRGKWLIIFNYNVTRVAIVYAILFYKITPRKWGYPLSLYLLQVLPFVCLNFCRCRFLQQGYCSSTLLLLGLMEQFCLACWSPLFIALGRPRVYEYSSCALYCMTKKFWLPLFVFLHCKTNWAFMQWGGFIEVTSEGACQVELCQ